ncbi:MAG: molybdopterin-guanine dinucleotide biosynthesis protein B, partial [Dehalococcoidaceae bacterium]|nr:molybdopterin-guanine dinucleotide biosynthesis protein B [Dehalococcoidaceae bacterium]
MLPIIAIVGRSNSGKTTLVTRLVRELVGRGYRVATMKDSHRQPTFDSKDKDSWKHIEAGSTATALKTHDSIVVIRRSTIETDIHAIAGLLGQGHDIVIAEGFKHSNVPKIEVHRTGMPLLEDDIDIVAIASQEPLESTKCVLSIDDIPVIADFVERKV